MKESGRCESGWGSLASNDHALDYRLESFETEPAREGGLLVAGGIRSVLCLLPLTRKLTEAKQEIKGFVFVVRSLCTHEQKPPQNPPHNPIIIACGERVRRV